MVNPKRGEIRDFVTDNRRPSWEFTYLYLFVQGMKVLEVKCNNNIIIALLWQVLFTNEIRRFMVSVAQCKSHKKHKFFSTFAHFICFNLFSKFLWWNYGFDPHQMRHKYIKSVEKIFENRELRFSSRKWNGVATRQIFTHFKTFHFIFDDQVKHWEK